jgi:prepilin-type N-terminal cleavage/methylation domain-containing protein
MHKWALKNKGFTIVELLIVIVVIAILAAISILAYNGIQNRTSDAAVQSDLRNLAMKIEEYKAVNGSYPKNASSTVFGGGIVFKVNKAAFSTDVANLYYCAIPEGEDAQYVLVAQSRSASRFVYKNSGFSAFSGGTWTNVGDICSGAGIPSSSEGFTYTQGYSLVNNVWQGWTQ